MIGDPIFVFTSMPMKIINGNEQINIINPIVKSNNLFKLPHPYKAHFDVYKAE